MEKTISKKLLAGICALSAGFVLASCDPIEATPKCYNDPIINNVKNEDEKENLMGKIYDAVAADRNSKIVSDILDEVALGRFGDYAKLVSVCESTDEKVKTDFIAAHADVFVKADDKDAKFVDEESKKDPAKAMQLHRLATFYEDVKERISEFFYNEITSGTYNDDEGRFDEGKLWMAHYYELYDLDETKKEDAKANKFFVTNAITKENAFSKLKGNYSNSAEGKRGYIEEKVYPQIMKDKLVEEYVLNLDNGYSSLGRAYARKVNYIKVSYEDHVIPWKLLKSFAESYVQTDAALDFEIVVKALKGLEKVGDFKADTGDGVVALAADSASNIILKSALGALDASEDVKDEDKNGIELASPIKLGSVELIPAGSYYKDTKLGELIVSFKKAQRAEDAGRFPIASDKAELDKFLASGKSKEYGLREKLISLSKEDYTNDGWYVKNGGLSELPSALRDRLFNINVSNSLDDVILENGTEGHEYGKYQEAAQGKTYRLPYMRNINGKKFVIPAKSQSYEENHFNYIYQDVEGKAFYMIEVLEAPSTSKFNVKSEDSYTKIDAFKREDTGRQVAKILGTKDSYIKDAYTKYLEKYTFVFYETSLYDHFQSEYPDLFDDEK